MSEEELDDLSMPEEIGETDSQDEMYEHFSVTVDKGQGMLPDRQIPDQPDGGRLAQPYSGRSRRGEHPGRRHSRQVELQGQAARPHLDRNAVPVARTGNRPREHSARHPLRGRRPDHRQQAGRHVVHPGHGNYTGTLVNALTYHLKDLPLFQSGDMRAGLVHRIDKNTSGILVIAKNERRTPGWPSSFSTIRSTGSTTRWYGATWSPTKAP